MIGFSAPHAFRLAPAVLAGLRRSVSQLVQAMVVALVVSTPARAQQSPLPGWMVVGQVTSEFDVAIDHDVARSGRSSVRMQPRVSAPTAFIATSQWIDVQRKRDQRIRLSAWFRLKEVSGRGAFVNVTFVDAKGTRLTTVATAQRARSGTTTDWLRDSITMQVPHDATSAVVSVVLDKAGTLWVDDVSIEDLDRSVVPSANSAKPALPSGAQLPSTMVDGGFETTLSIRGASKLVLDPPRPASPNGLDAMIAFTRLAGYVRFFHPTDSVVATNWPAFLTDGMRTVESASSTDSVVRTLTNLFAGMAPSVKVFAAARGLPEFKASRPSTTRNLGVAWWQHRGVGLPTTTIPREHRAYSSKRMIQAVAANDPRPPGAADPDKPLLVELGAGVAALLPTALWVTMPSDTAKQHAHPASAQPEQLSVSERAVRLASIAEVWMVMQHFYPYFDVAQVDWAKQLRISLSEVATNTTSDEFEIALKHLMTALGDGHGYVERKAPTEFAYGIVLRMIERQLLVTRVMDSTRTDVRRGDIVLQVNGKPTKQYLAERMAVTPGATRQWREYRITQEIMQAPTLQPLLLQLRTASSARAPIRSVALLPTRNAANGPLLTDVKPRPTPGEMTSGVVELHPGIVYVDLEHVSGQTLRTVLSRVRTATDIIFDVRGFPRLDPRALLASLTDREIRSAHLYNPITTQPDHKGVTYEDSAWTIRPLPPRLQAHAYFLVDGRVVSSAEQLMGIVEMNKLGEIVGEPTAGTNGNINPFQIPGGFTIRWTGLLVRKQDGSPHHGVGITPTVIVHPTVKGVLEGRDEQLERALALVEQRIKRTSARP